MSEKPNLICPKCFKKLINERNIAKLDSIENKWVFVKETIINAIEECCPLKKSFQKKNQQSPWFDAELRSLRNFRDYCYQNYMRDKTEQNLSQYRDARREPKSQMTSEILRNARKFYKTSIKLRGDAEIDSFPEELCWDVKKASTPVDQVEMFNSCFASIESSSLPSESESAKYTLILLEN
ncbi:hypothetical protein BpHYR1_049150 [Brachionus plicatilis]|uniref:Uncharacterized protein n=1 Tax=Brachionus plicatilis TaxID=10195 RepID=A0A3M7QYR3_BRAPC|nr:hypothetical protein BpHYR1_049150 [Brachionus plicatilis]